MAQKTGSSTFTNVAVFIILEVASLCMLGSGSAVRQMWLGRGFTNAKAVVWSRVDRMRSYFRLDVENDRLAAENTRLLSRMISDGTLKASMTGGWITSRTHFKTMPANIVTMTTGSQHNYLIIDRGEADGVETDDGIITSEGVVGIVSGVTRHFCYAISYANKGMTLSVRAGMDGTVGSLNWSGIRSDESLLSDIPIHTTIESGDTIRTSGFSSIFPPDIPIGTVIGKKGDNGSTADFYVRLFNDFKKITHVIIVKNTDRAEITELTDVQ